MSTAEGRMFAHLMKNDAPAWIEERFREQREWRSEDLWAAAREAGLPKYLLWSDEVNAMPIMKKKRATANGDSFWVWIAEEGWPA